MSDRMSTNIEDLMDPNILEDDEERVRCPPSPELSENDIVMDNKVIRQTVKPDLIVKNPNVSNIKANVSVHKNLTDTFFTESNILLFIIIIIAGLPQTNNLLLQVIPQNFQNDMVINILKAIVLCVLYIVVINYLL
jgi:hypothetical protein